MLRRIKAIFYKEFTHLLRDKRQLALIIGLPVFLLIIFGYAVSFDVKDIKTAVFDQDKSAESRELITRFTNSGYFTLTDYLSSNDNFEKLLDGGQALVILNIPPNFSKDVINSRPADIQILVDGSDPNIANSALSYISSITESYSQVLIPKFIVRKTGKWVNLKPSIKLITRVWYNPSMRSLNFYIPGLICLILMMMSGTLTSLSIVGEKERGTMESLAVSPIRPHELMIGKLAPYVLAGFLDVLLVTAIGTLIFKVPFAGNFLLLLFCSVIFLMGALGVGLFISTVAKSSQEAMFTALLLTMLPTTLMSDFIFPIENMPILLRFLTYFIPARYFLVILRGIFLKGVGIKFLWGDIVMLSLFSLIIILAAASRFKKRIS
ncbi:MAG: ABC transporter permease [Candidatus Margulisiibacteriota bacterium]|nr:ABC transporter permease [Candidatus Margulisiibacteriota bacterium]